MSVVREHMDIIIEHFLLTNGYFDAKNLSKKIYCCLRYMEELLS